MPTNTQAEARPRRALGKRPAFYGDERLDMLFAMLTALLGEVSVIRERLDTHERLLEKAGLFGKDTVDAWLPDADAEAERAPIRQRLMGRVLRYLEEDMEPAAAGGELDRISKEVQHGDV